MSSTLSSQTVTVAGAPQPTSREAAAGVGSGRIVSLDIMRGLVMVIMALDHTRDFFTNLRFEPEALSKTYYALFFARWITHFCAPLFFFLAGTGAFFYCRRRTPQALSRFLWTRGLWLIVLELTVVGTGWTFLFPWGFFGVIWALGACMVLMAAVVRMPLRWVAAFSAILILGHDLLDPVRPQRFGSFAWLWTILHVRGGMWLPFVHIRTFVLFPLVPWVGVMAAGYVFGSVYLLDKERRQKLIAQIGLGLTLLFIFLRLTNLYGNPPVGLGGVSQGEWHVQPTIEKTMILFFDVEKYPPSLQFLLMTLGPSLLLLAWLDKRLDQKDGKSTPWAMSPLLTFGRVPMFFYILHLYLIHSLAILVGLLTHQPISWLFHGGFMFGAPDGWGYGLPFVYLMWITAVVILYFPCRWFEGVKQRRKDWWLSYI
jgi:uncharacterized membrane protein